MREILFRGKRLDNGEWVYGYYVYIGPVSCQRAYIIPEYASALYAIEVAPSTVGQYTGLKDKNGKMIFEGDILGSRYDDLFPDDVTVNVIKWFRNGWYAQQGEYLPDSLDEDGVLPYSEVIGNVTDNPEMGQAHKIAISAIRRQETVTNRNGLNKPLTLDELRQMDGEPVWVVWPDGRIKSQWFIVGSTFWIDMFVNLDRTLYKDYGKTWLAYRNKPEEDDHETN